MRSDVRLCANERGAVAIQPGVELWISLGALMDRAGSLQRTAMDAALAAPMENGTPTVQTALGDPPVGQ